MRLAIYALLILTLILAHATSSAGAGTVQATWYNLEGNTTASTTKIVGSGPQSLGHVVESRQAEVAIVAKQASYMALGVAVVYTQAALFINGWCTANRAYATLKRKKVVVLLHRKATTVLELISVMSFFPRRLVFGTLSLSAQFRAGLTAREETIVRNGPLEKFRYGFNLATIYANLRFCARGAASALYRSLLVMRTHIFSSVWLITRRHLLIILAIAGFQLLLSTPLQAETVTATWYGSELEGSQTSSGETFHGQALTAAHPTAPFGTLLRVCYRDCTTVRVNDRPDANTSLDLSEAAAERVGLKDAGRAAVTVEQSSSMPITKLPNTGRPTS